MIQGKFTCTFLGLTLAICLSMQTVCQITRGGEPVSWSLSEPINLDLNQFNLSDLNGQDLMQEDETISIQRNLPYRFAVAQPTNLNLHNDGRWITLQNGDRIWQISFYSEGAKSLALNFSDFFLPKGAVVHIYNPERTHVQGGFTSTNNKSSSKFATSHLPGNRLILEYYEPLSVRNHGRLTISSVSHAYRDVLQEDTNDTCEQSLGCETTQDITALGSSVVRITVSNGTRYTTGVLLNNTSFSGKPLILTSYDALFGSPDTWIFDFNLIDDACSNVGLENNQNVVGAELLSSDNETRVAILELSLPPLKEWGVQYAGWKKTGDSPQHVSFIHHPSGGLKKYNKHHTAPYYSSEEGQMLWILNDWDIGTSSQGSLGGPLFDENNLVIGWYVRGSHDCENGGGDVFARLYNAWPIIKKQMDPFNTGMTEISGFYPGFDQIDERIIKENIGIFPNPTSSRLNIVNNAENGFLGYEIIDMTGRQVAANKYGGGPIEVHHLFPGNYLIRFTMEDGFAQKKFIKSP